MPNSESLESLNFKKITLGPSHGGPLRSHSLKVISCLQFLSHLYIVIQRKRFSVNLEQLSHQLFLSNTLKPLLTRHRYVMTDSQRSSNSLLHVAQIATYLSKEMHLIQMKYQFLWEGQTFLQLTLSKQILKHF